jgi:hypothetical protein
VARWPVIDRAPTPAAVLRNALRSMALLPVGTAADFGVKKGVSPDGNV